MPSEDNCSYIGKVPISAKTGKDVRRIYEKKDAHINKNERR